MPEWRESYPEPSGDVPDRGPDQAGRLDGSENRSGRPDFPGDHSAEGAQRALGWLAVRDQAEAKADWSPDEVLNLTRPGAGWVDTRGCGIHDLGGVAVRAADAQPPPGESVRHEWAERQLADLDLEALRRTGIGPGRFSEARITWVPVDLIEATDEVRGEPFKGGEPTSGYAAELARLHAEREARSTLGSVDPRHVGDHRIRLCENPDTGLLSVTNGRHRVEAAREAGIPAVLAEVLVLRETATPDDGERQRRPPGNGWKAG
ncbi:hypothetical protein DQ239_18590 [Blastococcus sp. TF02-09]|uniref:hypothetical protein n=1 Tax=Blastococcus sp. TF02-09 TaxID=2250576 RepID=UPI000DEB4914|nr:hypothetical protein [Blastococcus sp. TF02-9]RBY74802.1 hypothetical protein DQ239_18590 [Blastococcus sp. TF02-9]